LYLLRFYDFFAGAGLATLGLAPEWECIWANDIDPKKASVYCRNHGDGHFHFGDVARFTASDLPHHSQLAWASFPCQDLSLAGYQRGLNTNRSGTFWAFWKIMRSQFELGQRPPIIVIENVLGLLYGDTFRGLRSKLTFHVQHPFLRKRVSR
jgi:DNA (cytosine-5)-methyltransferase 1